MTSPVPPGKKIGAILTHLVQSSRLARAEPAPTEAALRPTTLGEPLIEQPDASYRIDLSQVRLFSGLRSFAGQMAVQLLDQARSTPGDLLLPFTFDRTLTPELAALGVSHLLVHVRATTARMLSQQPEALPSQLQAIFGALRTPAWETQLFPRDPARAPVALLFPFEAPPHPSPCYFLLEQEAGFLRLTIELAAEARLQLKHIPHRVVKDLPRSHYRADIAAMAEQLARGVHRQCENQCRELTEIPARFPPLFERLMEGGLSRLSGLTLHWPASFAERILTTDTQALQGVLARVLALLEDDAALRVLAQGRRLEVADGPHSSYLDVSRHGASLNISLDTPRPPPDAQRHLRRLPRLRARVGQTSPQALAGFRVLLIHHATSEVLGLVKALQQTGAEAVTTLFVRYRGIIPPAYIEDLLSLPAETFSFFALQDHLDRRLEHTFRLSRQLSPISAFETLETILADRRPDYLNAMRITGLQLLWTELRRARQMGHKILLIEDGGYLGPLLNQWALDDRPLSAALEFAGLSAHEGDPDPAAPLQEQLLPYFPFTMEHTANGFYALRDLQEKYGRLAFPALTMATSKYKNQVEAEACAYSLFEATEHILSAAGRTTMQRRCLVLGCRGNIGRHLYRIATQRATHGGAVGIDLRVPENAPGEYTSVQQVPREVLLEMDLILGVVGHSILPVSFLEDWLLHSRPDTLYLASGSTKTCEFEQLSHWLEQLAATPTPTLGGQPITVETERLIDPQTGLSQGLRVSLHNLPGGRSKSVCLLGDGMPLNFLYYGVPGEVIDGVLDELFHMLLTARAQSTPYAALLHALDQNFHFTD